eukprot:1348914-Prymnesium_polylepis.1
MRAPCALAGWSAFIAALSRRPLGADTQPLGPGHAAIPRAATFTRKTVRRGGRPSLSRSEPPPSGPDT